ncbi:MAG: purine-binding chemotaxis protein CheW [Aquabacterium sp.]|nr:purine-binding chemotaxis protein CheW [Aquabacterium sp.]
MIPQRGGNQYLTFTAAGTTYAMSIVSTKEIIEYGSVTRIPLMPAFIRGVINVRGLVLPVIDLAARLGFPPARPGRRSCIVIVEMTHEGETFDLGVVVDGVNEVLELDQDDLEPPPRFGANIRSDFIEAMAHVHGHFVIVMHLEQVLSIEEVSDLARVSESRQLLVHH